MDQLEPKVSICVSSYNHAEYLPIALDSALSQTYRNFEIVIVDDGSTDESLNMAGAYAVRYPDIIRVYTHPNHCNKGVSATHNLAIQMSRGVYIARLESDDVLCPNMLECEVRLLDENPNIGLVSSRVRVIDEIGRETEEVLGVNISNFTDQVAVEIQGNVMPAQTIMYRRECINKVGLFDETLVLGDWELWIRILAHWRAGFVDCPLAMFRRHGRNLSAGQPLEVDLQRLRDVLLAIRQKAFDVGGQLALPRLQALIDLQLTYFFFCSKMLDDANANLVQVFETDSSLRHGSRYLAKWLERRRSDPIQPIQQSNGEMSFEQWFFERISQLLGDSFASKVERQSVAAGFANQMFEHYRHKEVRATATMLLRCICADPLWLGDGDIRHIAEFVLLDKLIGSNALTRLYNYKKRLVG